MKPWIGFDFDGTLAEYAGWRGAAHCGAPIEPVVARVKALLAEGQDVRVFTARIHPLDTCIRPGERLHIPFAGSVEEVKRLAAELSINPERMNEAVEAVAAATAIRAWCKTHIGQELAITNVKDFAMVALFDDRAFHVVPNTGVIIQPPPEEPSREVLEAIWGMPFKGDDPNPERVAREKYKAVIKAMWRT